MRFIDIFKATLMRAARALLHKDVAADEKRPRAKRKYKPLWHINQCGSLVGPMHPDVQKKFRDACKPLPRSTYTRGPLSGCAKFRTPKLHLFRCVWPVSADEYIITEGQPIRRREPKNEYKARMRAEWKQKVRGMRMAAA